MSDDITVTLPREEFFELSKLLQLMCALGARLDIQGADLDMTKLGLAFRRMNLAGIEQALGTKTSG